MCVICTRARLGCIIRHTQNNKHRTILMMMIFCLPTRVRQLLSFLLACKMAISIDSNLHFTGMMVNELQARGTNELIITVNYDLVCLFL